MSVSDQDLAAYVDGELSPDQRSAIDAALESDPGLSGRLAEHRELRERVEAAFAVLDEEPVPARLVKAATVSGEPSSNVVSLRPRSARVVPGWIWRSGAALAAALAVGLFLPAAFMRPAQAVLIGPDMRAHGALAQALDDQLASDQNERPIRIGVSFRASDRHICRTFEARSVAGLACRRSAEGWSVLMATAAQPGEPGSYRTAASPLPAPIADLAQSLAAGPPLNAHDEAAEKSIGWR